MTELKIDVSEAWDGNNPIRVPKFNPNCIPTEQDVIDVLEYFEKNEPVLLDSLITFIEINSFLQEGQEYADIQGSS